MSAQNTVYVVEDDAGVRKSLGWMLESSGFDYEAFESGSTFLRDVKMTGPSCLILDMHLPGAGGIEVLQATRQRAEVCCPVIMITSSGTVGKAVESMKNGAEDFLEKPMDHELLLERVRDALRRDAERRQQQSHEQMIKKRVDQLTNREHEMLSLLCEGKSSKEMAAKLGISIKTVSIHRWHPDEEDASGQCRRSRELGLSH